MKRLVHIDNFDGGLVTNVDRGDLPEHSATRLENIRNDQPGKLRGTPGYKIFESGPSNLATDLRHFQEVVINDTQVMLVFGLNGTVHEFHYSSDGGTTWIQLTEVHTDTLDGATTSPDTSFVITTGNSNIDDHWLVYVHGDTTSDYVLAYNSGTNTVTTKYGVGTASDDTSVTFFRFPFMDPLSADGDVFSETFANLRNLVRDASNYKPVILQRQEGIAVLTGRKQDNVTARPNNCKNFWFGHVNTGNLFDDADFAFTGFHMEPKRLEFPNTTLVLDTDGSTNAGSTAFVIATGDDDLLDKTWGFIMTIIYDGYQESDTAKLIPGTGWLSSLTTGQVQATVADEITVYLEWDRFTQATSSELFQRPVSRRMTHLRIYAAQVTQHNVAYDPDTSFYLINEISFVDTDWAASGTDHILNFLFNGTQWTQGQANELEFNRGHLSRTFASADFGTTVKGREILGSLTWWDNLNDAGSVTSIENQGYLVFSTINSANRHAHDATALSNLTNMGEHGIYKIQGLTHLGDRLIVFGENRLVEMEFNAEGILTPFRIFEEKGIAGIWSHTSKGDTVFWGNQESIYELGQVGRINDIGFAIKDTWQGLSTTNRKNSIANFSDLHNSFILHSPSGTTYIYDTILKSWRTYVSDRTWEWISIGVDGEVLATDKTDIYELFPASGSTESMTAVYEKIIDFEKLAAVRQIELMYKVTGTITVKVFDLEKNENFPTATVKFFSRSIFDAVTEKMSFRAKKVMVQITISATTNPNWEIDWFSFFGETITENL